MQTSISLVNFTPISDVNDVHDKLSVVNGIDYPIITNAQPETAVCFLALHLLYIAFIW